MTTINITGKPIKPHQNKRINTSPARGQKKSSFTDAMAKAEAHKGNSARSISEQRISEQRIEEKSSSTDVENVFSRQAADDKHNCDSTDGQLNNQPGLVLRSAEIKERQLEASLGTGREDRRVSLDTGREEGLKSAEFSGTELKQPSITGVQPASRGSTHTIEKINELSALIDRLSDLNDSKTNQWTVKILDRMSGVNDITLSRSVTHGWTIDINLRAASLSNAQSNDLQTLKATLQKRGHRVNELSARKDDREQTS